MLASDAGNGGSFHLRAIEQGDNEFGDTGSSDSWPAVSHPVRLHLPAEGGGQARSIRCHRATLAQAGQVFAKGRRSEITLSPCLLVTLS